MVEVCLRMGEDDMVTINSWHHTVNLAEQLTVECYRVGAVPLMTDKLWYEMMCEISAEKIAKRCYPTYLIVLHIIDTLFFSKPLPFLTLL